MTNQISNEALANATKMYLSGSSMAAASRECRVPIRRLNDHLERLGIKRRVSLRDQARNLSGRHPRRTDVTPDEVANLYEWGWSVARLAEKFQCNRSVIESRLRQAGVEHHTRSEAVRMGYNLRRPRETHD
jgi:lambda repressor-like predicted transcriptional regulator